MDNIDPRSLPRILRIEGLIPFTLCAILLGFVVTLWDAGFPGADWTLFIIAGAAAVLIHIDGHIRNDIMDLEIDRREKSKETRRDTRLSPLTAGKGRAEAAGQVEVFPECPSFRHRAPGA